MKLERKKAGTNEAGTNEAGTNEVGTKKSWNEIMMERIKEWNE